MKVNPIPIFLKIIELDMTREEAAARAKISVNTLRKIENGQLVRLKSLKRLCLSLGIKIYEVLENAATSAQTQGSEDLGDRRGAQANEYRNNAQGAGREGVRELLSARKRNNG